MSKKKRILTAILCFALVFVLGGEIILSAFFVKAQAAESTISIATSDPLDDLEGATVLGEEFDASKYVFKEDGEPQFLMMSEYAFTARNKKSGDFELYFYFYNPSATQNKWTDFSNTVNLQYQANGETITFPLKIVSFSKRPGFEHMFYKLKIDFENSPVSRLQLLELLTVTNDPREYNIVSFNLNSTSDANDLFYLPVGNKFVFKGFMKGYGYSDSDETTLECTSGKSEVIPIEVGTTYYRADLLNNAVDENGFKQEDNPIPIIDAVDSLHSLYVAIPNDKLELYGKVTSFRGQYLDALTKPMLIVGDEAVYKSVLPFVGTYIGDQHDENLNYRFYSGVINYSNSMGVGWSHCGYAYHYNTTGINAPHMKVKAVDTLEILFPTAVFGQNASDAKFLVSGEQVKSYCQNIKQGETSFLSPSGTSYGTKFFETIDEKYTPFETNLEGEGSLLDLTGQIITESFWSTLFPAFVKPTVSNFYPDANGNGGVTALHKVIEGDFDPIIIPGDQNVYTEEQKISRICDKLYIAETDYKDFKEYYDKATQNNCTVYLVRYRVSNYYAEECSVFDGGWFNADGGLTDWVETTNACFVQMHVDLGLELLDVEFTKDDGVITVIPLTMKPVDFFPDITGPVNTTSDQETLLDWLGLIFKVLLGLAVLYVFMTFGFPLLKIILNGFSIIIKILLWPLKWLYKRITKK